MPNFLYSFSFSSAIAEVMSRRLLLQRHLGAHLGEETYAGDARAVVVQGDARKLAHAETQRCPRRR